MSWGTRRSRSSIALRMRVLRRWGMRFILLLRGSGAVLLCILLGECNAYAVASSVCCEEKAHVSSCCELQDQLEYATQNGQ